MKRIGEKTFFVAVLVAGLIGFLSLFRPALTAVSANTTVQYDASLGGLPASQQMSYATYGEGFTASSTTQIYQNNATVLDSTAEMSDYAGYGIDPDAEPSHVVVKDSAEGFKLIFTVRIEDELHANNNRTGFSVILLDKNAVGIELGFTEDTVYAREGNGTDLFRHAEDISFNTTNETTYELEIIDDTYTLTATGMPTLTGDVRDYSDNTTPHPIIPDPYEQPNFIFLGDNTTSGQAKIHLKYVAEVTDTAVSPTVTPTNTAVVLPTNTPTVTATATATSTAVIPPTATATGTAVSGPTETPDPISGTPEVNEFLPLIQKP